MKIHYLLFFSIVSLSSCVKEESMNFNKIIDPTYDAISNRNEILLNMGFDTTNIITKGNYYIVENDIMIHKDNIIRQPVTRQFHTTNTVNSGQLITIGLNSVSLFPQWAQAVTNAAALYTQYTGLVMKFTAYDPDADIVVSEEDFGERFTCAQGEFPGTNGKPGKNVTINSMHRENGLQITDLSYEQKLFLIMHEVGHNLGLRHSDYPLNIFESDRPGAIQIPGTPYLDDSSYMNSGGCERVWKGMPYYDEIALSQLFPIVDHTIQFANSSLNDITFNISMDGYKLDRTVYPERVGYAFRGWSTSMHLNELFDYNKPIYTDLVLYPRWSGKGSLITESISSTEGVTSKTINIPATSVVTITSTVRNGLNSWNSLKIYDDTYTEIHGDGFTERIVMKNYMSNLTNESSCTYTQKMVLYPGTYTIKSAITTQLGEQSSLSGKHGYTSMQIEYY